MKFRLVSTLALALSGLLQAQQGSVSGPVSGYLFDQTARALRPVLGLPGASLLGSPISLGLDAASAFVAPSLDSAVVVGTNGSVHLFNIQSNAVTEVQMEGLAAANRPLHVVFSPSGSAAAIYAAGSVFTLSGLPNAPALAATAHLGQAAGNAAADSTRRAAVGRSPGATRAASPAGLAISDDAAALLVSSGSTIRLFNSGADIGKLTDASDHALIAFAGGGHDAAVSDPSAGVVLFHDVLAGSGASQVVAQPDSTSSPSSGLAFSSDGKTLFLASSSAQTVTQLDLIAGSSTRIACNCAPTGLTRMGRVFRLNELAGDPLWLLDVPDSGPRVVFVPALAH